MTTPIKITYSNYYEVHNYCILHEYRQAKQRYNITHETYALIKENNSHETFLQALRNRYAIDSPFGGDSDAKTMFTDVRIKTPVSSAITTQPRRIGRPRVPTTRLTQEQLDLACKLAREGKSMTTITRELGLGTRLYQLRRCLEADIVDFNTFYGTYNGAEAKRNRHEAKKLGLAASWELRRKLSPDGTGVGYTKGGSRPTRRAPRKTDKQSLLTNLNKVQAIANKQREEEKARRTAIANKGVATAARNRGMTVEEYKKLMADNMVRVRAARKAKADAAKNAQAVSEPATPKEEPKRVEPEPTPAVVSTPVQKEEPKAQKEEPTTQKTDDGKYALAESLCRYHNAKAFFFYSLSAALLALSFGFVFLYVL